MTDLDALTTQLLRLGIPTTALALYAALARDTAAHVELLTVAYNQAVYERPEAVMVLVRGHRACRCGETVRLRRLGSAGGRWCQRCYDGEMKQRKVYSKCE